MDPATTASAFCPPSPPAGRAKGSPPAAIFTANLRRDQQVAHMLLGHEADPMRARWLQQVEEAAAQEERNRLARDLHDSIKQQIFSMQVSSAAAEARWGQDPAGALE